MIIIIIVFLGAAAQGWRLLPVPAPPLPGWSSCSSRARPSLTMTGGGDGGDGRDGGDGGVVLQAPPLTPGDNDTGDDISDGHVGPDPESEVMFYGLRFLID